MGEAEARVDIRRGQMVSPTTGEDISSLTQETFIEHLLGHGPGFTKTVCVCVCVCLCVCAHAHVICGCVFGGEEDTGMQTVMTVRSALFTR